MQIEHESQKIFDLASLRKKADYTLSNFELQKVEEYSNINCFSTLSRTYSNSLGVLERNFNVLRDSESERVFDLAALCTKAVVKFRYDKLPI